MFRNLSQLRLGTKFTLLLSAVFCIGTLAGGATLWGALEAKARGEVTSKGSMLIEMLTSVRSYTTTHIQPLLNERLATSDKFIAETVPAFSAREVFDTVRKKDAYADYFYKEAALNPTNPRDKADTWEADLIGRFRSNPDLKEISEFRTLDNKQVYYIARPLPITDPTCLACHTTPETAPASLIRTYGREGGFGWKLNEIIGARLIYVPADTVLNAANQSFVSVMAIFIVVFAAVLFLLNRLLTRYVIQPLRLMSNLAKRITADEAYADELHSEPVQRVNARSDELGDLGKLFVRMGEEVSARTERLKNQVAQLNIEIDEIKREKHVNEVVDSEFFRDLQNRAADIRKQRRGPADSVASSEGNA